MISGGISSAASVLAGNFENTNFTTNTDVALNSSFIAKVGFLANGTVLTSTDTFASINVNWTNAGNITFATGDTAGYNGYFSGQVNFTDALGLAGKNIFIWVTDGGDNNYVGSFSSLLFKADAEIPNSTVAPINQASLGSAFNTVLGSFNGAGANSATGGSLVLNNVPEPSAALLGAIGALGLLRRRRI